MTCVISALKHGLSHNMFIVRHSAGWFSHKLAQAEHEQRFGKKSHSETGFYIFYIALVFWDCKDVQIPVLNALLYCL